MNTNKPHILLMPAVAAACASVAFVVFVLLFPSVFTQIETTYPSNYKQRVEQALQAGQLDKALRIAESAAGVSVADPDVHALCGSLWLMKGDVERAAAAFRLALAQTMSPPSKPRPNPPVYYHSSSRLELGKLALERGDLLEAIEHFELARAYDTPSSESYAELHPALYRAYAAADLWHRALGFAEPTTEDISRVSRDSLELLGRACAGARNWPLALRVATEWVSRAVDDPTGHFLLGRAYGALADVESARGELALASRLKHPDAPFFQGLLEENRGRSASAIECYLKTSSTSFYRPAALAEAIALMRLAGENPATLEEELTSWFTRKLPVPIQQKPVSFRESSLDPLTMDLSQASPGWCPVLIRWSHQDAPTRLTVVVDEDGCVSVCRDQHILQVQWVMNEIPFSDFQQLQSGRVNLPGWVDPDTVWTMPPEPACNRIGQDGFGNRYLEISSDNPERFCRVHSVPLQVQPGLGYIVAGKARALDAPGVLGWVYGDRNFSLSASSKPSSQGSISDWAWGAAYTTPQVQVPIVAAQVGIHKTMGKAAFDDLMLFNVHEPQPP